jgi:hypothetical protein
VNWIPLAEAKQDRYEQSHGELDERAVVRLGNAAYAAGLARLMAGDADAALWFRRAAARWRESWDMGAAADAWGRPAGALKAALLARDEAAVEELARWTLELGAATADSPIGRYAGALALLALGRWPEARHVAHPLRDADGFPPDVASALAAIAAADVGAYAEAARSVVASFEERDAYLEDVPVADTALVLDLLARRRGLDTELPASPVLPDRRTR